MGAGCWLLDATHLAQTAVTPAGVCADQLGMSPVTLHVKRAPPCYVETRPCCLRYLQEDTFSPTMTCQETLVFHAGVMLGGQQWSCHRNRAERVEEVLAAVGLRHSKDTLVGGCSTLLWPNSLQNICVIEVAAKCVYRSSSKVLCAMMICDMQQQARRLAVEMAAQLLLT
jgi:hypothetical protein